jgi:hypothetical protein
MSSKNFANESFILLKRICHFLVVSFLIGSSLICKVIWLGLRTFDGKNSGLWRNKDSHDENFIRLVQPVKFAMHRCREYRDADKAKCIVTRGLESSMLIGWKPSVDGWVKLINQL